MKFRNFFVVLTISLLAMSFNRAFAQANVNENQTIYLHVDGESGSDSNPGSPTKPMKTIQAAVNKALANNRLGIGTKVMINAGVYREAVQISAYKHTSAPITIQATTLGGTAIIDGADVLTNWYKSSPTVYAFPWKDSVDGCALPNGWPSGMPPIIQRNEMVFVNGAPLTQVMSASQLRAGTFYANSSYEELNIYPPSGTDMNTAKVEVSARTQTLKVTNMTNLVFRGLVFRHAASCMNQNGANVYSSSNILFDQDQVNWNNWGGLGFSSSSNFTVQNSVASYNGGVGLGAYQVKSALYQNNETDYNNWRGDMIAFYDFAQGGVKIMHAHGVTVNQQRSYNNDAQGLHFDTDNMNVTINNTLLSGNLVNLQLEASEGPVTVEDSSLCSGGIGLHLINTGHLTMTGNTFYNNGGVVSFLNGQFYLAGKAGGRIVTNWENGEQSNVYTSNTKLENNSFTAFGPNQYVFNTYESGQDWSEFIYSLQSSDNKWFNGTNSTAFGIPGGKHVSLSNWRSLSGQDQSSSWGLPSAASKGCWIPAAAYPDFHVYAHNTAAYQPVYYMANGTVAIPLQVKSFNFGTVQLSASGLPSGVSASFSPATLTSGKSTLTLTASKTAVSKTVPITVFAVSGSRVHTITFWVGVRPAA
jgi:hypothetical protein